MSIRTTLVSVTLPVLVMLSTGIQAQDINAKTKGGRIELNAGMLIAESDIFIGRSGGTSSTQLRGLGLSSQLSTWPNGLVPYRLHTGLSAESTQMVQSAIAHWNQNSSITMVDRSEFPAESGTDLIEFVSGPGCASWVGRQGQVQEIWASDFCTTGSMIHEIGHALGLLHEHTRSDRDQYLSVLWENIQPEKTFNFETSGSGTVDLGPFDFGSIMLYGEYFFSQNNRPTLVPIGAPEGVTIGQRTAASSGDLAGINRLYASDLSLFTEVTENSGNSSISFTVTNKHSNGAHSIAVAVNSTAGVTGFGGSSQWNCVENGVQLICNLDVLPGGASNTVTVSYDRVVSAADLSPRLSSKTYDLDLSNNGVATPDVGAALADAAEVRNSTGGAGAAAGGSFGTFVLVLLLLSLLWRQWHVVLRSVRVPMSRLQHAPVDIAASSSKTFGEDSAV